MLPVPRQRATKSVGPKLIGLLLALFATSPALAWDGAVSGEILRLDVTAPGDFSFRVILVGEPTMCTGGASFAYSNTVDGNYEVYVSTFTSAFLAGKTVSVFSNLQSGHCHIDYISVS
jgi:hypothetical protein